MGRLLAETVAPDGFVTLRTAALHLQCHSATLSRLIRSGHVQAAQVRGCYMISIAELERLRVLAAQPQPKPQDARKAVMLRVDPKRFARWERLAKKHELSVSTWLGELADQAVRRAK